MDRVLALTAVQDRLDEVTTNLNLSARCFNRGQDELGRSYLELAHVALDSAARTVKLWQS